MNRDPRVTTDDRLPNDNLLWAIGLECKHRARAELVKYTVHYASFYHYSMRAIEHFRTYSVPESHYIKVILQLLMGISMAYGRENVNLEGTTQDDLSSEHHKLK